MHVFWLCSLVLGGCGVVEKVKQVKDGIAGLTNPLITQGIILAVEEPAEPDLQAILAAADQQTGTGVTVMLADAADGAGAEEAPVTGARVIVKGSTTVEAIEESKTGIYRVAPGPDSPEYVVGQTWELGIQIDGDDAEIEVELPDAADADVPLQHITRADMILDLSGQGYQSVFVVVIDETGNVTYANDPQTISELLDLTANDDEVETVTIPGIEAFPTDSVYAVGIAGTLHSEPEGTTNMNIAFSTLQAGKLRFYPMSTVPIGAP